MPQPFWYLHWLYYCFCDGGSFSSPIFINFTIILSYITSGNVPVLSSRVWHLCIQPFCCPHGFDNGRHWCYIIDPALGKDSGLPYPISHIQFPIPLASYLHMSSYHNRRPRQTSWTFGDSDFRLRLGILFRYFISQCSSKMLCSFEKFL